VPLVMLTAGIIAAWIPARRAARVDPYTTLKDQ
jgi:ABC-type antimicrobial peptide transport system permease subunit